MKRVWALVLAAAVIVAAGWALTSAGRAGLPGDAGNQNDYGGGGGDYGGGGGDYGGGGGGVFFGGGDGGSGGSAKGGVAGVIFIVFFVLVIVFVTKKRGAAGSRPAQPWGGMPNGAMPTPGNHEAQIVPVIAADDPQFRRDGFLAFAKETFMTIQQAWTERSWEKIRPFEKEELFRQHELQLQEYIRNNQINVVERIGIGDAYLHLYRRDAGYEYLTVCLNARMNDYVIDATTRAVLKGDPNREFHSRYLMTFMRKRGVLTQEAAAEKRAAECPQCGAPLNLTSAGKCEYCGSIVTTGEFDWVLSDHTGLRPGMVMDERGVVEG